MALEKTTSPYELLIRFNDGGKIGAQTQTITVIKDGETVISARPDDAEPISLSELQSIVAAFTSKDWFVPFSPEEAQSE